MWSMRRMLGAAGAVAGIAWSLTFACNNETTESLPTITTSSTSSSSASGGSGGSTPTGGAGGACMEGSDCERACCKIVEICGLPVTCAGVRPFGLFDCQGDPTLADCQGRCILDKDCGELTLLLLAPSQSELLDCFDACGTGQGTSCFSCLMTKPDAGSDTCLNPLLACLADQVCVDFLTCTVDGTCGTPIECRQACQADFSTENADDLMGCACVSCAEACPMWCASGSGGAAGSGGTAGSAGAAGSGGTGGQG
jgi:hypothetical protein